MTTNDTLRIDTDSLTFTCDQDDHQTLHTYPRATDPVFNTAIAVSAVTATGITVIHRIITVLFISILVLPTQ